MSSLIPIVEDAYGLDRDEAAWLERLVASFAIYAGAGAGVAAASFGPAESGALQLPRIMNEVAADGLPRLTELHRRANELVAEAAATVQAPDDAAVSEPRRGVAARTMTALIAAAQAVYAGPAVTTVRAVLEQHPCLAALWPERPGDLQDAVLLRCSTPDEGGVLFVVGAEVPVELAPRRKAGLECVATHVAAGLRLRRRLTGAGAATGKSWNLERLSSMELCEAVLDANLETVSARGDAAEEEAQSRLREAALAIDAARASAGPGDEALDLWTGLVDGQWSLVESFETDGRRYLVALRNEPGSKDPRALSAKERAIAGYAALGYRNQMIAYAMGLAHNTVAASLQQVLRKLGLKHRGELVRLAARSTPPPPKSTKRIAQ